MAQWERGNSYENRAVGIDFHPSMYEATLGIMDRPVEWQAGGECCQRVCCTISGYLQGRTAKQHLAILRPARSLADLTAGANFLCLEYYPEWCSWISMPRTLGREMLASPYIPD
jgi:hypothetical protein